MCSARYLFIICFFIFASCKESHVAIENNTREENYKLLVNDGQLQVFQIQNCNFKSNTPVQNYVLINDSINSIFGTWSHIDTNSNEWKGLSKYSDSYTVSKDRQVFSNSCFQYPVFNAVLVKKYGDWDHQHANGYVLKPSENNISIGSITKIILEIYYDSELSSIPNLSKIKSVYGNLLSEKQIENWDNGEFNLDIQLFTNKNTTLGTNITLTKEQADQWLRIEIPIKNMQIWNSDKKSLLYNSITTETIEAINLTAETKSRLVYRNLDTKNFDNESTPKLFKEIAFRMKRFELEKK